MSDPKISVIGGDPVQRDLVESLLDRRYGQRPDTIAVEVSWRSVHWHVERAIFRVGDANENLRTVVVRLLQSEGFPSEETR